MESKKRNKRYILSEESLWERLRQAELLAIQQEDARRAELIRVKNMTPDEADDYYAPLKPWQRQSTESGIEELDMECVPPKKTRKQKPQIPEYWRMSDLADLLDYKGDKPASSARKFCFRHNIPTYYLRSYVRNENENMRECIVLKEDIRTFLKSSEKERRKLFRTHNNLRSQFMMLAANDGVVVTTEMIGTLKFTDPTPTSMYSLSLACENLENDLRTLLEKRLKFYRKNYLTKKNNLTFPENIDEMKSIDPPQELLDRNYNFSQLVSLIHRYHKIDFNALVDLCADIDILT